MAKKIFLSIFLAVVVAVLAESILVTGLLYRQLGNEATSSLVSEAYAVARNLENTENRIDYLETIHSANHTSRFTWINSDGTVLYDTDVDSNLLENHINRKEVIDALEKGSGESIRYSDTLSEETRYAAEKLNDGSVIRLAKEGKSVFLIASRILNPFVFIVFILMIISAIVAIRLAKSITNPINEIDLENPGNNKGKDYEELQPLLTRLVKQKNQIQATMDILAKRQRDFDVITAGMKEGLITINGNLEVISINNSALEIFGATREIVVGKHIITLDRTINFSKLLSVSSDINQKRISFDFQKDSFWYHAYSTPINNEVGAGYVIFLVDITAEKNAEDVRRSFSSNVSHELKTPLTSISGYAEIIKDGMVDSEHITDFAKRIYDESTRLIALVQDILKLSQLEETTREYKEVNLSTIVQKVGERLSLAAEKANVALITEIPIECEIQANPFVLEEIVYNLCDNAIKYNRENGTVTVSVLPSKRKLLPNTNTASVEIIVSDTGIGIPKGEKDNIFQRFYRIDKSRSKDNELIGGTGLGLAIVKHGVMYHGGEITVKSTLGKGTTIKVILPIKQS